MTPAERRNALVQLLAAIDQQIMEARALAFHPELDDDERQFAADLLDFRHETVQRVEAMIRKLGPTV